MLFHFIMDEHSHAYFEQVAAEPGTRLREIEIIPEEEIIEPEL